MLSIIVPVYNVKLYLEECIDSLLEQYYKNCEIIIVDDGSTDGSFEICENLLLKDSRIKVIHQANEGLPAARNTGLKHASGKYISFIDPDDIVSASMFTDLIKALETNRADVSICNFEVFNKENAYKGTRYRNGVVDYSKEYQIEFFAPAFDSSCNRVFRVEPIRIHKLEFEHKSKVAQEDYWFQIRLFTHISRIVTIRESHYKYRERSSSITKSNSDGDITKRCIDFLSLSKEYISSHSKKDCKEFLSYAYVNMFRASINNAPNTQMSTLENIVQSYIKEPDFKDAISKSNLKKVCSGRGLRNKYTQLCFSLLRLNFIKVFSFIESLRLKKLRSNNRTELYFD